MLKSLLLLLIGAVLGYVVGSWKPAKISAFISEPQKIKPTQMESAKAAPAITMEVLKTSENPDLFRSSLETFLDSGSSFDEVELTKALLSNLDGSERRQMIEALGKRMAKESSESILRVGNLLGTGQESDTFYTGLIWASSRDKIISNLQLLKQVTPPVSGQIYSSATNVLQRLDLAFLESALPGLAEGGARGSLLTAIGEVAGKNGMVRSIPTKYANLPQAESERIMLSAVGESIEHISARDATALANDPTLSETIRNRAASNFASLSARKGYTKAIEWVQSLDSVPMRTEILQTLTSNWLVSSSQEASAWVARQPPGILKDKMALQVVSYSLSNDLDSAKKWTESIQDPEVKNAAQRAMDMSTQTRQHRD